MVSEIFLKCEAWPHRCIIFFIPSMLLLTVAIIRKSFLKSMLKIFVTAGIMILVVGNLWGNPFRNLPNKQLKRAEEVAKKIEEASGGNKLNLAVIAESNYEDGYQYILMKDKAPVLDIDSLRLKETVTDQLFVVCEMPENKCDPTHSPKAEVANFGWSKVEDKWGIMGVTIFKLVHAK